MKDRVDRNRCARAFVGRHHQAGSISKSAARLWDKICPSCQARIGSAAHNCHFCGAALTKAAATSKTVR